MNSYYFDNAATTKLDEDIFEEMAPYFINEYGNASAIYKMGRNSRKAVEDAREKVAKAIGALPEEIYFTSGGSESDNTAIRGIALANRNKGKHIITSKIEHPAVLDTLKKLESEGFEVSYIGVNEYGEIDIDELKSCIREDTILISVMYANNEIGTIQPIDEIGKIARERNIIFHTDAVQAIGSIVIDVKESNIDSLSLSAHKFYGPKGIGALYIRKCIRFEKFINGGHQERNKRAGTENVPAIVGLGKSIEKIYSDIDEHNVYISNLRNYYEEEIKSKIPFIKINGNIENRLPGNSNISFRFIEGEGILLNLDNKGICASSGSACTSGSLNPSHVLLAIGLPHEIAHGSVRISLGKNNTKEEVDYLIESMVEIVNRLREMSPLYEDYVNKNTTQK